MSKDPRQVDLEEWLDETRPPPPESDAADAAAFSMTAGEVVKSDLVVEESGEPVEVFRMEAGRVFFGVDWASADESIIQIAVVLPHPDAVLVNVGPMYDGTWRVVLRDRFGVGHEAIVSGRGADPLQVSRELGPRLLASIAARVEKQAKFAEASAARTRAFSAGSGTIPAAPKRARAAPAGLAKPSHAGGSVPYSGSVPRNASRWDVEPDGVHVSLQPGLVWDDVGGREDRVFKTIRIAKDVTRGAVRE